jgi:molybdopterin/thiamine biosynthesis adenylyltransferase
MIELAKARVHIGGLGRVGTSIALSLHEAGITEISANDPQVFEEEQLAVSAYSRRSDLGRPKVHVLERSLDGRPGAFTPVVGPNQSEDVKPYLEQAGVIISCANQLDARLYLERAAVQLRKPIIQACLQDGRQALGGLITIWVPEADCSCFGCLFSDFTQQFERGEVLLPTVTRMIGTLAAHLAVALLSGDPRELVNRHNVLAFDLDACSVERMAVKPRSGCSICDPRR